MDRDADIDRIAPAPRSDNIIQDLGVESPETSVGHATNGSGREVGSTLRPLTPSDIGANSVPDLREDESDAPSDTRFAFSRSQLHKLQESRTHACLDAFGGLQGLAAGLRTDLAAGLSADETTLDGTIAFEEAVASGRENRPAVVQPLPAAIQRSSSSSSRRPPASASSSNPLRLLESHDSSDYASHFIDRRRIFGENKLPRRKQKSILKLMWIAFNDKLLILLTISASISLVIGIYQSVSSDDSSSHIDWVDGLTVVVAIVVIVLATAAADWQKDYKFKKLYDRKDERDVVVVRSGRGQHVSVNQVVVGDILHVEAGDVVAVDGVLVQASQLLVDESSISGESDLVHKFSPGSSRANSRRGAPANERGTYFISSGTTVTSGIGRYLVTSIGEDSTYGRTLMSLREGVQETPLQAKLGRLGKQLILFGVVAGSIFFLVLLIRFAVNVNGMDLQGPSQKAEAFFHILVLAVTVVVITVPEGLALNVTIALAFATTRMLKDNNLVRLVRSCEIMGNATCICSDKTGTLTQNQMTVVTGRIGLEGTFDDVESLVEDPHRAAVRPDERIDTSGQLVAMLSPEAKALIKDSVALNSTAFEGDEASPSGSSGFVGSGTETALLKFGRDYFGMGPLREERANSPIVAMLPFESSRKWMAVLVKLPDGRYRLLVKGAAEIVFEYCAYVVSDPTYRLPTGRLSESDRDSFRTSIQEYAGRMLRPVAIGYRDFDASEVFESPDDDPESVNLEWLASGLILVGVFGIRDPLRPEVVESVRLCQEAGVFVRMVTGDNFLTARAIAAECGIYTPGGVAMDGRTFRKLSSEQRDAVIPRLQVLARSSPEDKLLLVSHLKAMKETVAVTGDGTNDALALKAADVGFAMGIQGTEVAKEAASIILLDDNFASIVSALSWGRTVNDAVKKFLQFQFTINITAGTLTVVSELVGDAIFTVVQLLWINLIMDIFASLGLATDGPSPDFLKRKPEPRNAPIVSITMWKMILGQAIYQLAVIFAIHYGEWNVFNPDTEYEIEKLQTLVFNIYIWMQFFNQHNCRRVDNKLDIWYQGVLRNPWFIGVQLITILGQFIIIFKGGEAFDTHPLSGVQWGWSLLFGFLTLPLGALIRQVPDRWVLSFFQSVKRIYLILSAPIRGCIPSFTIPRPWKRSKSKAGETDQELGAVREVLASSGGSQLDDTAEQRAALARASKEERAREESKHEEALDLVGLVEAAKEGREAGIYQLELHPRTHKNDPILIARSTEELPPSQDPQILKYMIRTAEKMQKRRRRYEPEPRAARTVTLPTQAKIGKGLSWTAFVRSKRR